MALLCPHAASAQSLSTLSAASLSAAGALQSPQAGATTPDPQATLPEATELKPKGFMKGRFLVGANFSQRLTPDTDLGSAFKFSPFFRTTPRRNGWGPSFGLNWMSTDIYVPVNGQKVAVGTAKLRPVMVGIGYSFNRGGRLVTNLSMVGGYAINDARLDRALPAGYSADLEVKDAWVMRPQVGLTYAVTRRFALVGSMGYVVTNPTISLHVTAPDGSRQSFSDTLMTHYFSVSTGAAFSIF